MANPPTPSPTFGYVEPHQRTASSLPLPDPTDVTPDPTPSPTPRKFTQIEELDMARREITRMRGMADYWYEQTKDAILRADAAEQDKIRMSGLLGDQTLQADRYREGLEQMSRIVCTCPSPNNRGIPTNTVPCPTHSSGRFARHLLNPKEES